MRWHKDYELECRICHKKFIAHSSMAYYCPTCKVQVMKESSKNHTKAQQAREVIKHKLIKKKTAEIRDIVLEAERHNMTYGQYVAMTEGVNGLY